MKRTLVAVVTLAVLALVATVGATGDGGEEVTLTGEILDLHCYMLHPDTGKGAEHAKCANSCIERGLSAGFLSDGKVYMLLGPGHSSAAELVAGKAGREIELTGTIVEHGGARAIQVSSVGGGSAGTRPSGGHDHGDGSDHKH